MNRFGLPLVPAALMLWAINFIDRLFIAHFNGQAEVGIYSLAVRISSVIVFLMAAFQLAWPAFAYSIRDDREAKRTYSYVLTYLLLLMCWVALALGVLAPWLVDLLAPEGQLRPLGRRGAAALLRASPRTPATPCSRSGSAARGRRSTTGSSPAPRRP